MDECRGVARRAWQRPMTHEKEFDAELAEEFAKILHNSRAVPNQVNEPDPFLPMPGSFQAMLKNLIKNHGLTKESGTPDFVLACFLRETLEAFDRAVVRSEEYHGHRTA